MHSSEGKSEKFLVAGISLVGGLQDVVGVVAGVFGEVGVDFSAGRLGGNVRVEHDVNRIVVSEVTVGQANQNAHNSDR